MSEKIKLSEIQSWEYWGSNYKFEAYKIVIPNRIYRCIRHIRDGNWYEIDVLGMPKRKLFLFE